MRQSASKASKLREIHALTLVHLDVTVGHSSLSISKCQMSPARLAIRKPWETIYLDQVNRASRFRTRSVRCYACLTSFSRSSELSIRESSGDENRSAVCQTVVKLSVRVSHDTRVERTSIKYNRSRAMLFVPMANLPLTFRQIGCQCSMPFFSSMSVDGRAKDPVLLAVV